MSGMNVLRRFLQARNVLADLRRLLPGLANDERDAVEAAIAYIMVLEDDLKDLRKRIEDNQL